MLTLKVVAFLWPFLKEMLLGDKSILETIRGAKNRLALVVLILVSLILNAFTIPRLVEISSEYLSLHKKHEEALKEVSALKSKVDKLLADNPALKAEFSAKDGPPSLTATKASGPGGGDFAQRRRYAKEAFERMRQAEHQNGD